MASRFWGGGSESESESEDESGSSSSSSSGSSSGSSSDSSSSDSEEEQEQQKGPSKYLAGDSDSDSDDDDKKRVIRSAKDKRFMELQETADELRNKMKINDWIAIGTLYEKMNKQLEKAQRTVTLGGGTSKTPTFYYRVLIELEDSINTTFENKEAKKKMSSTNAKAFNAMRQKVKKANRELEKELEEVRNKPESDDEAEEESESESEDEASDEDEEEKADAEDAALPERAQTKKEKDKAKLRAMDPKDITWDMVDKKLKEIIMSRGKKGTDRMEQVDQLVYLASVAKTTAQQVQVLLHVVSAQFDVNPSMSTHMPVGLWKKCGHTLLKIIKILKENPNITVAEAQEEGGEGQAGVTAEDVSASTKQEPKDDPTKPIVISGNVVSYLERLDDEYFKSLQCIDPHTKEYIDRMQDEIMFIALADEINDYILRSGDADALPRITLRRLEHIYYKPDPVYQAMRAHAIREAEGAAEAAERAAAAGPEDPLAPPEPKKEKPAPKRPVDEDDEEIEVDPDLAEEDPDPDAEEKPKEVTDFLVAPGYSWPERPVRQVVNELTKQIYQVGDERSKARAMLCSIFHHALTNDWHMARDLMLMSHLQENIQHMDISTQILFNRTMAQLGLCAFRNGFVAEASGCLMELFATNRIKELLAQGVANSRYYEKTAEQEKLERRRQMPHHMHLNLELLEAVHLVCAMITEVPGMAANAHDMKHGRSSNRPFQKLVDNYEKQCFCAPPENVRDHVMQATMAMFRGEWSIAVKLVRDLTVWALIPEMESVLDMVVARIKEETLRTYLFTFATHYASLSHDQLCEMFDLDVKKVHSIVSKMIIGEELHGSWDQPTRSIVMHNVEPTRLQHLATTFSDKLSTLLEANERAFDVRTGGGPVDHVYRGGQRGWQDAAAAAGTAGAAAASVGAATDSSRS